MKGAIVAAGTGKWDTYIMPKPRPLSILCWNSTADKDKIQGKNDIFFEWRKAKQHFLQTVGYKHAKHYTDVLTFSRLQRAPLHHTPPGTGQHSNLTGICLSVNPVEKGDFTSSSNLSCTSPTRTNYFAVTTFECHFLINT